MTTTEKERNGFFSGNLSAYSPIRCSLKGVVKNRDTIVIDYRQLPNYPFPGQRQVMLILLRDGFGPIEGAGRQAGVG